MKALRYLLIVVAMISVLSVRAQRYAQPPQVQMYSTSAMISSGSTLPSAAVTGVTTSADYNPTKGSGGPRRDETNPFGDETIGGTTNPMEPGTPIGDGLIPLLLCVCAYLSVRVFLKRKRAVKG